MIIANLNNQHKELATMTGIVYKYMFGKSFHNLRTTDKINLNKTDIKASFLILLLNSSGEENFALYVLFNTLEIIISFYCFIKIQIFITLIMILWALLIFFNNFPKSMFAYR